MSDFQVVMFVGGFVLAVLMVCLTVAMRSAPKPPIEAATDVRLADAIVMTNQHLIGMLDDAQERLSSFHSDGQAHERAKRDLKIELAKIESEAVRQSVGMAAPVDLGRANVESVSQHWSDSTRATAQSPD